MRAILWSVLIAALFILGIMLLHGANAQSVSNCYKYGAGVRCESSSSSSSGSYSSSTTNCFQYGAGQRCQTITSDGKTSTTTCYKNGAAVRCDHQ
jgi:hypothetical protein